MVAIIRDIVVISIFFLCMAGSVAGVPSWPKEETAVGYFTVSKNDYGIAIYQLDKHASVQFNGFDAYTNTDKTVTLSSDEKKQQTIGYSRDDIVFDHSGNLYTEPPEEEQVRLEETINKELVKITDQERTIEVLSSILFIINPNIPGVMKIQFPKDTIVAIDRENKLIHVKQPIPSLEITIYDTIEEIRKVIL